MNLLLALSVLFSDDISFPVKIREAAKTADVESLNQAGFLNQECIEAIKRIQKRNEKRIKKNSIILGSK